MWRYDRPGPGMKLGPQVCFKSSGGGSQQVVQQADPWKGVQPYLKNIYKLAEDAYAGTSQEPFKGDLTAGPNATQQRANQMAGAVAGRYSNMGSAARQGADRLMRTNYSREALAPKVGPMGNMNQAAGSIQSRLNIQQMPDFGPMNDVSGVTQKAIDAAVNPLQQRLTEQILPGAKSASVAGGAYGGSRAALTEQGLIGDFTREAGDISARIAYDDLARRQGLAASDVAQQRELTAADLSQRMQMGAADLAQRRDLNVQDVLNQRDQIQRANLLEQQAMGQAAALQGQGFQQALMPSQVLQNVGQEQQGWQQSQLDDAYSQWQREQMAPWQGLETYAGLLQGQGPMSSVAYGQGGPSTLSRALSGGIGGALAGGALGYGMGAVPAGATGAAALGPLAPWALGGLALGGLMGFV